MKNILITGATGFVGSHVLQAASDDKTLQIIAACRSRNRLPGWFAGEVRTGDVNDVDYVGTLFDDIDTVCNCFAWTSMYNHADESEKLFLQPSLTMIDAAIRTGVKRFINISTTSAASPESSADPMSIGIPRPYWPHLCNVITIENYLRERAGTEFTVVNLRLGLFAGKNYSLGLLPILLPRLKTHMVPWVAGGHTSMPIVDGRDIGQAVYRAILADLTGYQGVNIVGPSLPSVREVFNYFHELGYPKPHFSIPFPVAFSFAWLMEVIDPIVPWEPLVTRSIIHLLRDVHADNKRAEKLLNYKPEYHWKEAVNDQLSEMANRQEKPMSMAKSTTWGEHMHIQVVSLCGVEIC